MIDTIKIKVNVSDERKAFMHNQFTGDLNFFAIQNSEIPDKLKDDLQDCLRCNKMPIYEEKEIQKEFTEWHNKDIFDFHSVWHDKHVVSYEHNQNNGRFTLKSVKTNNRPPGLLGPEYENMNDS